MPTLPCCARPFHAAHYPTPRDFFDAVANGSDETTLRAIVIQRAPFFVNGRGFRLVVENVDGVNAGKPLDVRLERNWRELGWFRRVVLTLLSCVVPRDRQRCARPHQSQLPAISRTLTRLRERPGMAVPVVPPSRDPVPVPAEPGAGIAEPRPRISPVLSPEARRVRLKFFAECIGKTDRCQLFANKAQWCTVVRAIAGNDPPECLDAVAAVVLAHMATVVTYLRRNRAANEAACREVMSLLEALRDSANAEDDKVAELAERLTAAWKRHWWRGEIASYTAFGEFRLPVGVAQRIGASLREDWLLVNDEFCTLDLRDRQIKRLLAAAAAKSAPADGATIAASAATGSAAPSLASG